MYNASNPVRGNWMASDEYNAVLSAIETLSKLATPARAVELHAQLDELNNEMIDLEHYLELSSEDHISFETAMRMRDVMAQRRDIQQQLQIINRINSCKSLMELFDGRIESPTRSIEKLYTPRSKNGEAFDWSLVTNIEGGDCNAEFAVGQDQEQEA